MPLENIEIIQNINNYKDNLFNLDITKLFEEYSNKNLALIIIEDNNENVEKVFIKTILQGKKISKSLELKKNKLTKERLYENIITNTKKELIDLVKSENLIDIRTPSFLNVRFNKNKKNNLVELNSRIKTIDAVENIFVQDFNKDYMNLRIKFLGKLEKIIQLLKIKNVELKLVNDQWVIKTL